MFWRLLALVSTGAWIVAIGLVLLSQPYGEDRGAMVGIGVHAEEGANFELIELSLGGVTPRFHGVAEGERELPRLIRESVGARTPILPAGPTLLRLRFRPEAEPRIITVETELLLERNSYCTMGITLGRDTDQNTTSMKFSHCEYFSHLFWGQPG